MACSATASRVDDDHPVLDEREGIALSGGHRRKGAFESPLALGRQSVEGVTFAPRAERSRASSPPKAVALAGLNRSATRLTLGTASLSTSSRLAATSERANDTPREISARPRQAGDQPLPDRVPTGGHDDGDRLGRFLGHATRNPVRHDAVHLEAHQVSRERRQTLVLALGPPPLDAAGSVPRRSRGHEGPAGVRRTRTRTPRARRGSGCLAWPPPLPAAPRRRAAR